MVVFKVNGTQIGQDETDANGLAQITVELTTDGTPTGALIPQGFFDEGIEASFAEEANFTGSTDTADLTVTPAAVTPTITAIDKIYDGTDFASITSCTVAPLEVGDDVECVVGTATYDDGKDVGEDKAITASDITLTGADAANYSLGTNTTATTTADIEPSSRYCLTGYPLSREWRRNSLFCVSSVTARCRRQGGISHQTSQDCHSSVGAA
jgi:hypothetical protein